MTRVMTVYPSMPAAEPGSDVYDLLGRIEAARGEAPYNVRYRLDSLSGHAAMVPGRMSAMVDLAADYWPLVARRFGLTHLILAPPIGERQRAAHELATGGATRVATTPDGAEVWAVPHREWAAFAPRIETVTDAGEALASTLRAVTARREAVVVEGWGSFEASAGRVLSVERGIEGLRIDAVADQLATLIVNDAWWPGWEATIDGAPVPIFRADGLVRAVRWPAGRHVLEMRYRPPEVRAGLALSVAGLVLLAGAAAALRRRRARPPH